MDILVTGSPGWLGTRLVQALTQGLDEEGPVLPDSRVRCLIEAGMEQDWARELGAQVVVGSLGDAASLSEAIDGVEVVFHVAGLIHTRWRTSELFTVNTAGTEALLAAAARSGVRRFVFVSSNSVGGNNDSTGELMTEQDDPRPYMAYGQSKHRAEQLVTEYSERRLLETVIVRPCWYYGPGQPARQTRFFKMIKSGRPLMFGTGRNLRSMSYVDNVVHGLALAATVEKAAGQTYWIADQCPYTMIEIYETVARVLGVKDLRPRVVPSIIPASFAVADWLIQAVGLYQMEVHVAGEMHRSIACSVEKANRELGYDPKVGLEEGMRRSIEWSEENKIVI